MSALRSRLPRFAALVLLVWLCATGVAFAHTCNSKIDLDCDTCCPEMKAIEAWTEPLSINVQAVQADIPLPAPILLPLLAWVPTADAPQWTAAPPDPGGGHDIPVFFLRLAL